MPIPPDPALTDDYARPVQYGRATGPREAAVLLAGSEGAGGTTYAAPRDTQGAGVTTPAELE